MKHVSTVKKELTNSNQPFSGLPNFNMNILNFKFALLLKIIKAIIKLTRKVMLLAEFGEPRQTKKRAAGQAPDSAARRTLAAGTTLK